VYRYKISDNDQLKRVIIELDKTKDRHVKSSDRLAAKTDDVYQAKG